MKTRILITILALFFIYSSTYAKQPDNNPGKGKSTVSSMEKKKLQEEKTVKKLEKQQLKKEEQLRKEEGKGSEQGQKSRKENSKKWWKFWGE